MTTPKDTLDVVLTLPKATLPPLLAAPGDRWTWGGVRAQCWAHVVRVEWGRSPTSRDPFWRWEYHLASGGYVVDSFVTATRPAGRDVPPGTEPDDYRCSECDAWWNPRYDAAPHGEECRVAGLCRDCNFWARVVADVAAGTTLVARRGVYTPGPAPRDGTPDHCLGFGGHLLRFARLDGSGVVESRNCWWRGTVPEQWAGRLPDNARLLRDDDEV